MKRTSGIPRVALALAGAMTLAGCGAALTAAVGGALAASGGSKGGGGAPNGAASVPTTQIVGDTSGGSVTLQLTVTDSESDAVAIVVRYSTDANESATAAFTKLATGTLKGAGGSTVDATRAPSSPSGTTYTFTWNTAQDLGTTLTSQVRLQVLVDGKVGTTTSTFVVDNTTTPVVQSATLTLPSGATAFADEQTGGNFIPVTLTLADAEASKVSLSALVSMDGGATFPLVAAGDLVDGSGSGVPTNAIPTSAGGTTYTFRLRSAANGLGNGGASTVVLRFQVSDTKTGKALDTTPFRVNNASFSAVLTTPSGSLIAETVDVPFLLIDAAAEPLDVSFQYSTQPGGPSSSFVNASSVNQPPFQGLTGLASSASGQTQHFVWNSFRDTFVQSGITSNSTITMRAFVTRPSTKVTKGPFPTTAFTIDHRLVETTYGKTNGVSDGVLATQSPLASPIRVAQALNKVYFADQPTRRIRVVDFSTGLIDTALGGGSSRQNGTSAKDYFLQDPVALAAAANGTLFVGENFGGNQTGSVSGFTVLRVDGSTPTVTVIRSLQVANAKLSDVCYERTTDQVFVAQYGPRAITVMQSNGFGLQNVAASSGSISPDDAGTEIDPLSANLTPDGIATNYAAYPNVLLIVDRNASQLLAANLSTTASASIFGFTISPNRLRTIKFGSRGNGTGDPLFSSPEAVAIDDQGNVYVVPKQRQVVVKLAAGTGASSVFAGTLDQFGLGGDGGPATKALVSFPSGIAVGAGGNFYIADSFNSRVRRVAPNGTITSVAGGNRPNGDGGVSSAAFLKIALSLCTGGTGLVVTDPLSSQIRQIDLATTTITAFAGNGQPGTAGDGGSPLAAAVGGTIGLVKNGAGDFYLAQYSTQVVRRIRNGVITTVAGTAGVSTFTADGTSLAATRLAGPTALAANGPCVAVGSVTSQIVLLNDGAGLVTSWGLTALPGGGLAGSSSARVAGDASAVGPVVQPANGLAARNVTFIQPAGVTMAQNGDLYVADGGWHAVFKINASDGLITRIVGQVGSRGNGGDGVATTILLDGPNSVALDQQERVLYVSDAKNRKLRMVNLTGGPVTLHGITVPVGNSVTLVGAASNGADGLIAPAYGGVPNGGARNVQAESVEGIGVNMATDASGRIFFLSDGGTVRYVDAIGTCRVLAGFDAPDGVTAAAASLRRPSAITVTTDGSRYFVVDAGRVRAVDYQGNVVSAFIGNGQQDSTGDGGPMASASLSFYASSDAIADLNDMAPNGPSGPRQISISTTAYVTSLMAIADTTAHAVRLANTGNVTFVHTALNLTIPPGRIALLAGSRTTTPEGIAVPVSGSAGNGALAGTGTSFLWPSGVAFIGTGVLCVSDTGNDVIRAINLSGQVVQVGSATLNPGQIDVAFGPLVGGNPFKNPRALAWEPTTRTLICQAGRLEEPLVNTVHAPQIMALNPAQVLTVAFGRSVPAGSGIRIDSTTAGPGPATPYLALRDVPRGVAISPLGDVYFCVRDGFSAGGNPRAHQVAVILNNRGGISGITLKLAGSPPTQGFAGDGGIPDDCTLNAPFDIATDASGTIYVLDGQNLRIRRMRSFP